MDIELQGTGRPGKVLYLVPHCQGLAQVHEGALPAQELLPTLQGLVSPGQRDVKGMGRKGGLVCG